MSERGRRLGYVLKRYPRISETFVAAELVELERQGEQVTVFALSRPDEPFEHALVGEVRADVVYLPHRPLREPVRVLRALLHVWRESPRGWLRAAAVSLAPPRFAGWRKLLQATVLRQELERTGIDHVHAHFATSAARLANLAWRMEGPSYSVTAHAKDIYHEGIRRDRLRDKLINASFVATVSEANSDYLSSLLPESRPPHVVSNAVDLRRLGAPETNGREPNVVLTVARLIEKKGLSDLVSACGVLVRRGVSVRLEVVGDGPLRPQLEAATAREGVPASFHGALPNEHVLGLYRRATVYCLPCVVASTGDRDGLPTSVLEAMALGLPVVATALNGLAEAVLHERTGIVVPGHDPEALADALERLLGDRELRDHLARQARRQIEQRFALERSVERLRELFPEAA
jgi:colanic acid/amylovoran biosynthesis glycosyltransferase